MLCSYHADQHGAVCRGPKSRHLAPTILRRQPVCSRGTRSLQPPCRATKGFGTSSSKRSSGGGRNKERDDPVGNWVRVAKITEFPADRDTLPVVLEDKSTVMLYKVDGEVFCSDAESTAFKYPLTHAKILQGASGEPLIEVPFDGTQYELRTGKVVAWCPKNNPIRAVLGMIKEKQDPRDLLVYPAKLGGSNGTTIFVNFSQVE